MRKGTSAHDARHSLSPEGYALAGSMSPDVAPGYGHAQVTEDELLYAPASRGPHAANDVAAPDTRQTHHEGYCVVASI